VSDPAAERVRTANTAFWDGRADGWRRSAVPPEVVSAVAADLGCGPGGLVLDAGCGSGNWSVPLAAAGHRVRGLDVSPRMVTAARAAAAARGLAEPVVLYVAYVLPAGSPPSVEAPAPGCGR
jgi:2-polyprenyl-3-methyl-5-hydroxy-6-metoxy-1,4-benzoquinol methylase